MNTPVLVSIAIPAYKPQFFEKALLSALLQDYEHVEVVVCDDCRDDSIAQIVERCRAVSAVPIRYFHNETPQLEPGNLARCIREARGEYIKFLYDDDLLMPGAVRHLLAGFQRYPGAAMVTCKRQMIDAADKPCGESILTLYPFKRDAILDGKELCSFLGEHIYNFIGEPSSVMCRRSDVLPFGAEIMSLQGEVVYWLGDIAMYVKLLQQGNLVALAAPLACFRISTVQTSQIARDTPQVAALPYAHYRAAMARLGWVRPTGLNSTVKVAALDEPEQYLELNLADYFRSGGILPMGDDQMQAWFHPESERVVPVRRWLAQRTLTPVQRRLVSERRQAIAVSGGVDVIVLARQGEAEALERTLASVACWVREASGRVVQHVIDDDPLHGIGVLNEIVRGSTQEWLLLLNAGDELLPAGTLALDMALADSGDAWMIYCDEVRRVGADRDWEAVLRPSLVADYLLGAPAFMAGHWLLRRIRVAQVGGYDADLQQAMALDIILRLMDQPGFQGVTHLAEPLLVCDAPGDEHVTHEQWAIERHLARRGYARAQVTPLPGGQYRIRHGCVGSAQVSIIVPGDQSFDLLQRCLDSLLAKTAYEAFELLVVDYQVHEGPVADWLGHLRGLVSDRLRIIDARAAGSQREARELAIDAARGDYLVLLDRGVAVVQSDWLDELLDQGLRPDVGIVAGTLCAPGGYVRHSALITGLRGVAAPAFEHLVIGQDKGYMGRLCVAQEFSAVPSSCVLLRKALYDDVRGRIGGLELGLSYDVMFCRAIRQSGLRVVWTPHARLEQAVLAVPVEDDGRVHKELEAAVADTDPAYNRNLTLRGAAFELDRQAGLVWRPLSWRPLPVVLACPSLPREARESRLVSPLRAMSESGVVDGVLVDQVPSLSEMRRLAPDVIVFQDDLGDLPLSVVRQARSLSGVQLVLEVHAFLSTRVHAPQLDPMLRWESLSEIAREVDRVIVPTQALADAFAPLHRDVRVVATRLGREWLRLSGRPAASSGSGRLRIGCYLEPSNSLDAGLIPGVIAHLADRVDWVLWGQVPGALRNLACEVHEGGVHERPERLVALGLHVALAPLGGSGLDACESAVALLRYAACGYGVVCSDVSAYANELEVLRVDNTLESWIEGIEYFLQEPRRAVERGRRVREQVLQGWVLDDDSALVWARAWSLR